MLAFNSTLSTNTLNSSPCSQLLSSVLKTESNWYPFYLLCFHLFITQHCWTANSKLFRSLENINTSIIWKAWLFFMDQVIPTSLLFFFLSFYETLSDLFGLIVPTTCPVIEHKHLLLSRATSFFNQSFPITLDRGTSCFQSSSFWYIGDEIGEENQFQKKNFIFKKNEADDDYFIETSYILFNFCFCLWK